MNIKKLYSLSGRRYTFKTPLHKKRQHLLITRTTDSSADDFFDLLKNARPNTRGPKSSRLNFEERRKKAVETLQQAHAAGSLYARDYEAWLKSTSTQAFKQNVTIQQVNENLKELDTKKCFSPDPKNTAYSNVGSFKPEDNANWNYTTEEVNSLLSFNETPQITTEDKYFVAGFLVGEGSLTCSIKNVSTGSGLPITVDLEFSVTQSNRNPDPLFKTLAVLQTGNYQPDSEKVFGKGKLTVDSRQNLIEKVCPFYEQYVLPLCNGYLAERFKLWRFGLWLFGAGFHLSAVRLYFFLLPVAFRLKRLDTAKSTFTRLEVAQKVVLNSCKERLIQEGRPIKGLTNLLVLNLYDDTFSNFKRNVDLDRRAEKEARSLNFVVPNL